MITAIDEICIDFSTSCSREVAVAKLLGWMQGPVRRKYIEMTEDGISEDQLPHLIRMEEPIADQLLEMREVAQRKLYKAFETDSAESTEDSQKALSDAAADVERHSQTIYLAAQYFRDIDDELAKGDSSELRLDRIATEQPDNPYISLSSLDAWSKKKYQIEILRKENIPQSIRILTDQLKEHPDDSPKNGGLGKVKANNLYVTLALFVETLAKSAPRYRDADGPVVDAIAKKIAEFGKENYGKGSWVQGQSDEKIKDSIEEAMRRMKKKLLEG